MTARIRPADASDVEAIVSFAEAVVPAHYTPILGAAAARAQLAWWDPRRMTSAVEAGRVHVAASDDGIVGVAETGEMAGDQVIWKLYLTAEFRGRSLGATLLRHAVAALPVGTPSVFVEHFAGNRRAGAFYEREGFTVVRTEPARTGDPNAAVVWRRLELR